MGIVRFALKYPKDAWRALRHAEVLMGPSNHEGVFTFDLVENGRE